MISRFFAIILFILLFPLIFFISVLITIKDGFPVFFLQKRLGYQGKNFVCYKFRTMREGAAQEKIRWKKNNPEKWAEYEKNNFKLKNDHRVTTTGKFLRKTSLDELPQIFNIIGGTMNFVGPRPLLLREKKLYGKDNFKYYKKVKPGVTGLWQVEGRSETSFADRIALDIKFIKNNSAKQKFFILLKTIKVVLLGKGAF